MYCRKCGKQINYDAQICKECENAEFFFHNPTPTRPVGDRKEGFGGALTATILSSIAFFISIIAMAMATVAIEGYVNGYYDAGGIVGACIAVAFFSLGLAIPAMVLGIKGMKCFFRAKREGRIKPIATLVCGIVGLVMSALTIFYVLLTFLICSLI